MSIRNAVELFLWLAFAWLWFLYLLVWAPARREHVGVAGALLATLGAIELCGIMTVLAILTLIQVTS